MADPQPVKPSWDIYDPFLDGPAPAPAPAPAPPPPAPSPARVDGGLPPAPMPQGGGASPRPAIEKLARDGLTVKSVFGDDAPQELAPLGPDYALPLTTPNLAGSMPREVESIGWAEGAKGLHIAKIRTDLGDKFYRQALNDYADKHGGASPPPEVFKKLAQESYDRAWYDVEKLSQKLRELPGTGVHGGISIIDTDPDRHGQVLYEWSQGQDLPVVDSPFPDWASGALNSLPVLLRKIAGPVWQGVTGTQAQTAYMGGEESTFNEGGVLGWISYLGRAFDPTTYIGTAAVAGGGDSPLDVFNVNTWAKGFGTREQYQMLAQGEDLFTLSDELNLQNMAFPVRWGLEPLEAGLEALGFDSDGMAESVAQGGAALALSIISPDAFGTVIGGAIHGTGKLTPVVGEMLGMTVNQRALTGQAAAEAAAARAWELVKADAPDDDILEAVADLATALREGTEVVEGAGALGDFGRFIEASIRARAADAIGADGTIVAAKVSERKAMKAIEESKHADTILEMIREPSDLVAGVKAAKAKVAATSERLAAKGQALEEAKGKLLAAQQGARSVEAQAAEAVAELDKIPAKGAVEAAVEAPPVKAPTPAPAAKPTKPAPDLKALAAAVDGAEVRLKEAEEAASAAKLQLEELNQAISRQPERRRKALQAAVAKAEKAVADAQVAAAPAPAAKVVEAPTPAPVAPKTDFAKRRVPELRAWIRKATGTAPAGKLKKDELVRMASEIEAKALATKAASAVPEEEAQAVKDFSKALRDSSVVRNLLQAIFGDNAPTSVARVANELSKQKKLAVEIQDTIDDLKEMLRNPMRQARALIPGERAAIQEVVDLADKVLAGKATREELNALVEDLRESGLGALADAAVFSRLNTTPPDPVRLTGIIDLAPDIKFVRDVAARIRVREEELTEVMERVEKIREAAAKAGIEVEGTAAKAVEEAAPALAAPVAKAVDPALETALEAAKKKLADFEEAFVQRAEAKASLEALEKSAKETGHEVVKSRLELNKARDLAKAEANKASDAAGKAKAKAAKASDDAAAAAVDAKKARAAADAESLSAIAAKKADDAEKAAAELAQVAKAAREEALAAVERATKAVEKAREAEASASRSYAKAQSALFQREKWRLGFNALRSKLVTQSLLLRNIQQARRLLGEFTPYAEARRVLNDPEKLKAVGLRTRKAVRALAKAEEELLLSTATGEANYDTLLVAYKAAEREYARALADMAEFDVKVVDSYWAAIEDVTEKGVRSYHDQLVDLSKEIREGLKIKDPVTKEFRRADTELTRMLDETAAAFGGNLTDKQAKIKTIMKPLGRSRAVPTMLALGLEKLAIELGQVAQATKGATGLASISMRRGVKLANNVPLVHAAAIHSTLTTPRGIKGLLVKAERMLGEIYDPARQMSGMDNEKANYVFARVLGIIARSTKELTDLVVGTKTTEEALTRYFGYIDNTLTDTHAMPGRLAYLDDTDGGSAWRTALPLLKSSARASKEGRKKAAKAKQAFEGNEGSKHLEKLASMFAVGDWVGKKDKLIRALEDVLLKESDETSTFVQFAHVWEGRTKGILGGSEGFSQEVAARTGRQMAPDTLRSVAIGAISVLETAALSKGRAMLRKAMGDTYTDEAWNAAQRILSGVNMPEGEAYLKGLELLNELGQPTALRQARAFGREPLPVTWMGNLDDGPIPHAWVRAASTYTDSVTKHTQLYAGKDLNSAGAMASWVFHKTTGYINALLLTGLIAPNPALFVNIFGGNVTQTAYELGPWAGLKVFSQGVIDMTVAGAQYSAMKLEPWFPAFGKKVDAAIEASVQRYGSGQGLASLTNAFFNPIVAAVWGGKFAPDAILRGPKAEVTVGALTRAMSEQGVMTGMASTLQALQEARGISRSVDPANLPADVQAKMVEFFGQTRWNAFIEQADPEKALNPDTWSRIQRAVTGTVEKLTWPRKAYMRMWDALEQRQRAAFFIDKVLNEGMSFEEAGRLLHKTHYDWNYPMSQFERDFLGKVFMFWGFQRRAFGQVIGSYIEQANSKTTFTETLKQGLGGGVRSTFIKGAPLPSPTTRLRDQLAIVRGIRHSMARKDFEVDRDIDGDGEITFRDQELHDLRTVFPTWMTADHGSRMTIGNGAIADYTANWYEEQTGLRPTHLAFTVPAPTPLESAGMLLSMGQLLAAWAASPTDLDPARRLLTDYVAEMGGPGSGPAMRAFIETLFGDDQIKLYGDNGFRVRKVTDQAVVSGAERLARMLGYDSRTVSWVDADGVTRVDPSFYKLYKSPLGWLASVEGARFAEPLLTAPSQETMPKATLWVLQQWLGLPRSYVYSAEDVLETHERRLESRARSLKRGEASKAEPVE